MALKGILRSKPRPRRSPEHEPGKPKPQRNFTDPQNRITKARDSFIQAYNAQTVLNAGVQIIVHRGNSALHNVSDQAIPPHHPEKHAVNAPHTG